MIYSQYKFFYKIAYMTLTFDLVTLTLGQLQHLIDINPMYDFDEDPIIRSWFIGEKSSMRTHTHTHPPRHPDTDGHEWL